MRLPGQPFFSRLSVRLLTLGLLLVFLPAGGFLYLDVYERQLLAAQERSMVQQGRLLAAALGGRAAVDPALAGDLLRRLERRTDSRLRVYVAGPALAADSARLGPRKAAPAAAGPSYPGIAAPEAATRDSMLYRGGAVAYRLWRRIAGTTGATPSRRGSVPVDRSSPLPEVRAALAGRYGSATRPTPGEPRVLTLHSALPVRGGTGGGAVIGAVLVSQSTHRILASLVAVRHDISRVFLLSVAAAVVLSLFVSATIARPLRTLREEANTLLDGRGRLRGRFTASARQDEIGHLTRALEQLTHRLEEHLRFTESFAADVSHEFKNPLATIRTATEMLAEVEEPEDRRHLAAMAQREVARMERLLSGVREITEIDAHLEAEPARPVDLAPLLRQVIESVRLRAGETAVELCGDAAAVRVAASPERLTQVLANVLDNGLSFSPPGGVLRVALGAAGGTATVTVEDQGPGIPEAHLDRIFERFFSYRPGEARDGHTGLGLAIVKAIVEGYGGSVAAGNRPAGGARFEIRLPALADRPDPA